MKTNPIITVTLDISLDDWDDVTTSMLTKGVEFQVKQTTEPVED